MKKIILSLLFVLLFSTSVLCQTQVINMTEDTTPTSDDIIYVINDPLGIPGDRKVQIGNLKSVINIATDTIWDAAGDLAVGTGANTAEVLPAGIEGYLLKMGAATPAWSNSISEITLSGFTASKGLCSDVSGNAVACTNLTDTVTGTGSTVLATTPTLVTPVLGAATATSLLATGIVDGTAPIVITATSAGYTLGATYKSGYTFTNPVAAAAAFIMTLPTPAAVGLQYCVGNGAAKTGTLTVNAGTNNLIDLDGTLGSASGYAQATAVAGNFACFIGVDSTHWKAIPTKGTWTIAGP